MRSLDTLWVSGLFFVVGFSVQPGKTLNLIEQRLTFESHERIAHDDDRGVVFLRSVFSKTLTTHHSGIGFIGARAGVIGDGKGPLPDRVEERRCVFQRIRGSGSDDKELTGSSHVGPAKHRRRNKTLPGLRVSS